MSFSINISSKGERLKEVPVKCNNCGKPMKAPQAEKPPYFCYYCRGDWHGQECFR